MQPCIQISVEDVSDLSGLVRISLYSDTLSGSDYTHKLQRQPTSGAHIL